MLFDSNVWLAPTFSAHPLIVRDGKVITDSLKRSKNDSPVKSYKGLLRENPSAAREMADRIIKHLEPILSTSA
jgi:hypothetical protein